MSSIIRAGLVMALFGGMWACETEDRVDIDEAPPPHDTFPWEAEREEARMDARQDFQALHTNVQESLRDSQREMDEASQRIARRSAETWEDLSTRARDTWESIRSDVDELRDVEQNGREIERAREEAAEELAELDGEIVRHDLEAAESAQDFRERAIARLGSLEAELTELVAATGTEIERDEPRDPADVRERPGDWNQHRPDLDADEAQELRERIVELRTEVDRIEQEEEFEDRRDDLAGDIGELTTDIREHWYQLRWSRPTY